MTKRPVTFLDTHFHAGPDIHPRRLTLAGAADEVARAGGIAWLKRHRKETVTAAASLQNRGRLVGGTVVVTPQLLSDSIALSQLLTAGAGPLKPIVSLPTVDAESFVQQLTTRSGRSMVRRLTTAIADADGVLATGHTPAKVLPKLLARPESDPLPAVIVTHAFHPIVGAAALAEELRAVYGVALEHTQLTRHLGHITEEEHRRLLTEQAGLIYSSDFGQPTSPSVSAWRRETQQTFAELGLSAERCWKISTGVAAAILIRCPTLREATYPVAACAAQ